MITLPSEADVALRDDLTVEVIFFGDAEEDAGNTGKDKIMVNEQATTKAGDAAKAKL